VKHRVLQIGRLMPFVEAELAERYDLVRLAEQGDPDAFLQTQGPGFVAIVTSAGSGLTAAQVDALPNARVACSFGVGYDRLDIAAAQRADIVVSNTPDVLNDCVADLAWGGLIDVARGLSTADRFVRRGDWARGAGMPLATQVSTKRLGVVGLGRIGTAIAQRAAGFRMTVRYHGRREVVGSAWAHEPDLVELARWADFLVVAAAGGGGTRHLVSREVLGALGPEGFLVNISRGSVVDEEALVDLLQQGRLAGAALDVFEREPQVPEALMAMDHVVLLPHIASATRETRRAMGQLVLDNLHSHFEIGQLLTPVQ
jgi:lactate dehydrogenase-like 2-hydroxyacid dehydrogenase